MQKDQAVGALILVASIAVIVIYGWLLFFVIPTLLLQITAFVGVAAILVILGWIGWTMATTPPPPSLEEISAPTSTTTSTPTIPKSPGPSSEEERKGS